MAYANIRAKVNGRQNGRFSPLEESGLYDMVSPQAASQKARFQTMFADDLKAAHTSNNRLEVCRLIKSIPASRWTFHVGHAAMTSYEGVGIAAFSSGGSGINSYDEISIAVFWPDGTQERPGYLGRFSKDELRLPNYAPTDTWSF